MSNNDHELRIKITTQADVDDLNTLNKGIKVTQAESQSLSKDTQKLTGHKTELKHILRELGHEFPLLGTIGRAALNPLVAGVALLVGVVAKAREAIHDLAERSTPEFGNLQSAIEAQRDALDQAATAASDFERAMVRIASTGATVTQASAAYVSLLEKQKGNRTSVDDAAQRRDQAALEAMEKAGVLSHGQAIMAKLQLEEMYAARRLKIENELAQKILAERHRERANLDIENKNLKTQIAVAGVEAGDKAGKAEFGREMIGNDKKNLEATKKKVEELEEEIAGLHDQTKGFFNASATQPQAVLKARKAQAEQELLDQSNIQHQLETKLQQEKQAQRERENAAKAAQENVDAMRGRAQSNQSRISEINRTLPQETIETQAGIATRTKVAGLDSETRAIEAAGQNVTKAVASGSGQVINVLQTILSAHQEHGAALAGIKAVAEEARWKAAQQAKSIGFLEGQMRNR